MAKNIHKDKPVLVTGATGYLAGWVVKQLLEQGHTVHAAMRSPDNTEKTKNLTEMANATSGNIKFFKSDLLDEGSFTEAMHGCELVIHTASPFIRIVKDPQRDLVNPAVNGTKNVLNSVNQTSSVKRVVLTSSCASIYGDTIDAEQVPNKTFTEEHWNTTSSVKDKPYSYSKVEAEKAAWELAKAQERWDLVVINPSLIVGPATNPQSNFESKRILKQFGDGSMKAGAPEFYIGAVDVRDVAEAHVKAGFIPEANGRHILSENTYSFLQLADALRGKFGNDYPLPKKQLPKWLVWLAGPMSGLSRPFVSKNIGHPLYFDHSKAEKELGIQFNPASDAIVEFFEQMVEVGLFEKK